ncbi:GntR family transcriptional regulator [Bradyrhizobium elkanii]|uniref:hypothetical protein n=1 Tax=Bradyrhizobium elkanii TaxID=29448 RepID=UPI002225E1B0|nr:hypothetical protein [Bradyrhizobium elkanii]MCW2110470.1 hypothetical protein [Bradyrhizobium elkanii]WLB68244.1 hypothetical protein QIH89_23075 [Bradyrhizobium elkanii]
MARKKRGQMPRHVQMPHYLMNSEAWKSLGAIPRAIYLDMAKRHNGTNNGRITYSVREAAEELNIGLATASRALDVLRDRGFIVCMKKGAFSLKVRHASEWRITDFICNNDLPTREFMRFENKTRYPQRKRPVAVVEAFGSCGGSEAIENPSDGSCSGSVEAGSVGASVSVVEHI